MAKRCAEVFMVSVTPQKRSKTSNDNADSEEEIILTLAPFQPQPKLIYNDVKVGTAKSCNFTVLNPTKKTIEIEFELPNDENLCKSDSGLWKWSQTRLIVEPGQSEVINVIWTPSKAGSHHFSVPVKQICNGNPRKLSNISISSTCVDNSKQLKAKNKKPNCRPLQEKNVYVKSKNTEQQKQVITVTTPKTKEVKKPSPTTYTKVKNVSDVKLDDSVRRNLLMNSETESSKTPKNSNKTTILDHELNDILPKDSIKISEYNKKTSPDLTYSVGPLDNSGIPDIPENYERDSLDGSLLSTNSFTDFEKQLNDINLVSISDGDDCLTMPFRSSVYETNKKEQSLKNLAAARSDMALNKKFDNITFSVEKVGVRKRRSTIIEVEENETTIINSETFISITNNTYCLKTPDKTFDVTNLNTNINSETFISIDPSIPLATENVEVKKEKEIPCFLWKLSPPKRMRNEIKSDSPVVLPTSSKVSMAKNRMGPPLSNNVISKRITRSVSSNSLTSSDNNVQNKSRFSFNNSSRTSSVGTPNISSKRSTDPRLVKSTTKARRPSTTFTVPKARLKLVSSSMDDLSDGKNNSKQPGKSDSTNDNSFTDSIIPKLSDFSKNPFCKELFFFLDVKTIDDAEKNLLKWVNAMLSPPIELEAVCTMPSQKQIISYSRSCIREYPARLVKEHRLKVVRRAASVLLQSDEITTVLQKLHVAIDRGAVAIRDDCDLHLDVGLQEIVLKLLLCYHPLWLRVALETVYKQNIPLNSNSDVAGLVNFIRKHLISDDYLKKKYAHPTVPFRMMPDFEKNMKKFILNKFLVIIYFLDIAKQNKLIRHDPCLFCKDSAFKTNHDVLQEFYKKFVKGGCNSKYLTTLGYKLLHKQTYLDEFDLKLNNRNDLRDGIRLMRLMEIILNYEKGTLYSQLRAPALSGFQKNHNVKLALNAFRNAGYVIENGTTEKDIINGHREKMLSFLWQLRGTTFNAAVIIIQKFWVLNRDMIRQRTEFIKMRKAACKIQNWYRIKRAAINSDRENFVKLKLTAIFVQRCYRKKLAIRKLNEDLNKKVIATIIIQRYYRSYLKMKKVRNEFLKMKSVVLFVQQRYREIVSKRKEREFYNRFIKPVRIIQQWWRSIIAMRRDRNRLKKLKSAVLFVEVTRKSNLLVREIRSNFLTLKFAAVTLQSRWRAMKMMKSERSKYVKLKSAVSFIDTKRKANLTSKRIRSDFLKMKSATITLQRRWKSILIMRKYRLAFLKLKYAVSLVEQRRVANLLSKKHHSEFLKLKSASLTIQRRWRAKQLMEIHLNAYLKLKWAVSVVEQKRRTNLQIRKEMTDFTTLKMSAIIIQRWWRSILIMKKERIQYKILKSTVIFVEEKRKAKLLMVKEKSNFDNLRNASIKIQQKWRSTIVMKQDRNRFMKMKWAVSFIEQKRRTILITRQKQADFITLKTATIKIQKWWRGIIAMKKRNYYLKLKWAVSVVEQKRRTLLITRQKQADFITLKTATITIQKWWRGIIAMKKRNYYLKLKWAVSVIEQKRRTILITRQKQADFIALKTATITIQKWWRGIIAMKKRNYYLKLKWAVSVVEQKRRINLITRKQQSDFKRLKMAAITIQKWWRTVMITKKERNQFIILKATVLFIEQKRITTLKTRQEVKYKIILHKIMKLQRWWRRILNMKKQKEFLNQQRVSALEDEEKKTKEDAAIKLQKAVRNWLSNRRNKKHREHAAAVMIQAFWKGYRVRKERSIDTRKLSVLKLPETKTLRELKTGLVLNMGKVNSIHVLITYLQRLEMMTSLSTELSEELVEEGVVEVLYNWLNKLTRGVSDQSAAFFVVAVLINLVKFRNTADSTWTITCNKKNDKGYETILTYCVQSFKSNKDLFCCCVTLLWLWSHDPEKLKVISGAKNLNYVVKTINREIPANNKPNKKVNAVKMKKLLPSKVPNWGLQNTKLGPKIFNDLTFAWQTLLKQFKLS